MKKTIVLIIFNFFCFKAYGGEIVSINDLSALPYFNTVPIKEKPKTYKSNEDEEENIIKARWAARTHLSLCQRIERADDEAEVVARDIRVLKEILNNPEMSRRELNEAAYTLREIRARQWIKRGQDIDEKIAMITQYFNKAFGWLCSGKETKYTAVKEE